MLTICIFMVFKLLICRYSVYFLNIFPFDTSGRMVTQYSCSCSRVAWWSARHRARGCGPRRKVWDPARSKVVLPAQCGPFGTNFDAGGSVWIDPAITAASDAPPEDASLQVTDAGANRDPQNRQNDHAGKEAFQIIQRTCLEDIGANAMFSP